MPDGGGCCAEVSLRLEATGPGEEALALSPHPTVGTGEKQGAGGCHKHPPLKKASLAGCVCGDHMCPCPHHGDIHGANVHGEHPAPSPLGWAGTRESPGEKHQREPEVQPPGPPAPHLSGTM